MPPVTRQQPFMETVDELIDAGTGGITSLRRLSQRMTELDDRQTAESWRTSLRRYRGAVTPKEETIALVAQAFGVPRERFPPGRSPALAQRVTELEQMVATLERELAERAVAEDVRLGLEALEDRLHVLERASERVGA